MLHVLLCKNVIPSFPKGQATRRGPHSSPTFAMGFRPFFPMPGGGSGLLSPAPPALGVSGDFWGNSGCSLSEGARNLAVSGTERGELDQELG